MVAIIDRRVVDNRVFLLGLDYLYREALKGHERSELLDCARDLVAQLDVSPAPGPIEGYYTEDARLTEYFLLMRALQDVDASLLPAVAAAESYRRLRRVTSSELFGTATDDGKLLPSGQDSLSKALGSQPPSAWTVPHLTQVAHEYSVRDDEISLVGLAARAQDSVVLAALRESVVLYAARVLGAALRPPQPEYVWEVDEGLARQAARFVAEFNELFEEELPDPSPENVVPFWESAERNVILGRCVCIGADDSSLPVRHYHWAIGICEDGEPCILERWDSEVWTTERFRRHLRFRDASSSRSP